MSDDPSIWSRVLEWVAGISIALIGLVWADNKRRMDNFEEELSKKAGKDELDRQRDHIIKLFEEQAKVRHDMNGGFQRITDMLHEGQISILTELAKKAER